MKVVIEQAQDDQMKLITHYVSEYRLDDEDMRSKQFLVAKDEQGTLVGFGRLRKHTDGIELCTLGVVTEYRSKGIGTQLAQALIAKANSELYLVCIIPHFFKRLGLTVIESPPASIERKYHICTTVLAVEEPYFCMKLEKK